MKQRYRFYRRQQGGIFYVHDSRTGRQESLRTKDRAEAALLTHAKNEASRQPALNLQMARAYLMGTDPAMATRTWQQVMDAITKTKEGETQVRWLRAIKDTAFDWIRNVVVLETQAEQFLQVLQAGTVATNVFLRRMHNFALGMNWLPCPILLKKQWPAVRFKEKRAITFKEHQRIIQREHNPEWRAFYELCWHLGGSQSDVASLCAEDVDWSTSLIAYRRGKTGSVVQFHFAESTAQLLAGLPGTGRLFPRLAELHEKHRAKLFRRRCLGLGISGVSLHSYRYAWAERARACGYPERFAQEALGHNSKAVHRAYARRAQVRLPALEAYERQQTNIIPLSSASSTPIPSIVAAGQVERIKPAVL